MMRSSPVLNRMRLVEADDFHSQFSESRKMSLAGDRTPEMPTEKRDLPDLPTESGPDETKAIEITFGGSIAILFGHADLHRLNGFHNHRYAFRLRSRANGKQQLQSSEIQ